MLIHLLGLASSPQSPVEISDWKLAKEILGRRVLVVVRATGNTFRRAAAQTYMLVAFAPVLRLPHTGHANICMRNVGRT